MTPGWSVDLSTTRPPIYPKQFRVNIDRLDPTSERVNRRHLAPKRAAAAAQTRRRIPEVGHDLFLSHGWNGTAIAEIARRADVSVDTVYASIGRKPVLIREVIDDVLGGERGPVPAEQRGYVVAVRAAPSAADKIAVYGATCPTSMSPTWSGPRTHWNTSPCCDPAAGRTMTMPNTSPISGADCCSTVPDAINQEDE